ncbi:ABC transporter ATP-binding protein [Sanguibacter sp. 25GB23B1]|uniref:ABC transporter ATP-binding protein n=1 Tax=unclassified Sanguibacter TaxID=2645534 RepID=UPI0032B0116C
MTHATNPDATPVGPSADPVPGFRLQMEDARVRFGPPALDGLSLDLAPGVIHGLLGRNGSGKTTALSLAAGFRRPSGGRVLVDGEDPFENPRIAEGVCFVRESGDMLTDEKVRDNLAFFAQMRPAFDREYAESLADVFQLDRKAKVKSLSRGQQSALGAVVGLATRAPLTILDEVYLGMDAPSRYAFYDALLADYVTHPRTFVLSSHLIGELERLLESVAILHRGRLLLADDVASLRSRGATLTGPFAAVDTLVHGARLTVVNRQELGRTSQVTVFGVLPPDVTEQARALDVEVGPVGLQDLFVHITTDTEADRTGQTAPVLSTAKEA